MSNELEIRRIGHAFYRVETPGGKVILIDPWLEQNPTIPGAWQDVAKYADADYVLLTHGHFDHVLGVHKVMEVAKNATLIAQFELVMVLLNEGIDRVLPTNVGSTIELDGLAVSAVSATHSSSFQDPDTGKLEYRGTPMGYVLEVPGGYKAYFAGDTGYSADMKFVVGEYFKPNLAVLPCDGLLTMSVDQAVFAAEQLGVDTVIPSHEFPSPSDDFPGMAPTIESFPFIGKMLDKRASFAEVAAKKLPGVKTIVLDHGEATKIEVG